jgi:hypothetical protein
MAYVPTLPGFSPVSYGQGYGDWQQYAGFDKDNPFGSIPGVMKDTNPKTPAAPVGAVPPDTNMPPADYSIVPPTSPYGAAPTNPFGQATPPQASPDEIRRKFYGQYGAQ